MRLALVLCLIAAIALLVRALSTRADAASVAPVSDARGRPVDWKLLFHQLFALEIRKQHGLGSGSADDERALDRLLIAYTAYLPASFADAIATCAAAESSNGAYEARRRLFFDPASRQLIADFDLRRSVGDSVAARPRVRAFLDAIERYRDRAVAPDESFFASPEGRNVVTAMAGTGGRKVAFVMVPGYAAHTIEYPIFEEMVVDANRHYGRPALRPVLAADGIDLEFEDHASYYARGNDEPRTLDLLHPAGAEMGNTAGYNAETADLMYDWIRSLPPAYDDAQLILLGYSKGAPIVLELLARHPELSERLLGVVSFAGVIQGTNVARTALAQADELLRGRSIGELIDQLQEEDPESLGRILSPLFAHVDVELASWPVLADVLEVFDYDVAPVRKLYDRLLDGRELRELLDGLHDLAPVERTRWNLLHFDDDAFRRPAFVMNLSAITDIEDFVQPLGVNDDGSAPASLLAPVLTDQGELDWSRFSNRRAVSVQLVGGRLCLGAGRAVRHPGRAGQHQIAADRPAPAARFAHGRRAGVAVGRSAGARARGRGRRDQPGGVRERAAARAGGLPTAAPTSTPSTWGSCMGTTGACSCRRCARPPISPTSTRCGHFRARPTCARCCRPWRYIC